MAKGLETRLAEHQERNAADSIALLAANRSGETTSLDWDSAVRMLAERNYGLVQGRLRIEQLRKTRDEQWKTWLPRVAAYTSLQTSLAQLGDLSFSDLNTSIIAPLTIPNPLTERARAFQNALSYLEAQDSYQLTYRRQVSTLYRLFSQYESTLAQAAESDLSGDTVPSINVALGQLETRASQRDSLRSIQSSLAQMLNMPGHNFVPVSSSRPRLAYERKFRSFVPGKNYAQLAMRLGAYQLEGALLREKGIKLNRFPSFSLSGSTPPVYDSRRDDTYLDTERIFLFGGLSKSYDFTGREADTIESAEQNTAFVRDALRQRLDQETREWIRLQNRYEQLLVRRRLVEERLDVVRKTKSGGSAATELESLRTARENLRALRQGQESLDLELWVWDESQWN